MDVRMVGIPGMVALALLAFPARTFAGEGAELYARGEYERAAAALQTEIAHQEDATSLALLADSYRHLPVMHDQTQDAAQRALKLDQCSSLAHMVLGIQGVRQRGNYCGRDADATRRHLERAVECDPGNAVARFHLWMARCREPRELDADEARRVLASGFFSPAFVGVCSLMIESVPPQGILFSNDPYPYALMLALQRGKSLRADVAILSSHELMVEEGRRIAGLRGVSVPQYKNLKEATIDAQLSKIAKSTRRAVAYSGMDLPPDAGKTRPALALHLLGKERDAGERDRIDAALPAAAVTLSAPTFSCLDEGPRAGARRRERLDKSIAALRGSLASEKSGSAETVASLDAILAGPRAAPGEPVAVVPRSGEYLVVDVLPEVRLRVPPSYPEEAREHSVEGQVVVQALISKAGRVVDVCIASTNASSSAAPRPGAEPGDWRQYAPLLDHAALDAVKAWEFNPARSDDRPVAVWVAVPVTFRLR